MLMVYGQLLRRDWCKSLLLPFSLPSINPFILNTTNDRSTAILAHVPWLWTYLRLITGAKARTRSYALAIKYVNRRIQGGSKIKDLFYHLVSTIVLSFGVFSFCLFLLTIDGQFLMLTGGYRQTRKDWNPWNRPCKLWCPTVSSQW